MSRDEDVNSSGSRRGTREGNKRSNHLIPLRRLTSSPNLLSHAAAAASPPSTQRHIRPLQCLPCRGQAEKAGTGPEGHKRSASVESGAGSDTTLVGDDQPGLDARSKAAEVGQVVNPATTPAPRVPKRAASISDLGAQPTKRGRVNSETASGAPVGNNATNEAKGSSTAAAPNTISSITAAAPAAADNNEDAPVKPEETTSANHSKTTDLAPVSTAATKPAAPTRAARRRLAPPPLLFPEYFPAGTTVADFRKRVHSPKFAAQLECWTVPPPVEEPKLITSVRDALDVVLGIATGPVDWAAIAAQAPRRFHIVGPPPPSSAARRYLGPAALSPPPPPPPKTDEQIAMAWLSTLVSRGQPDSDDNSDAEDELDEIRNAFGELIAGASPQTVVMRPAALEKTDEEIEGETDEAWSDELETLQHNAYEPAAGLPDMDDPAFDEVPECIKGE